MLWALRDPFNGMMRTDVAVKGEPRRRVTWRAPTEMRHDGGAHDDAAENVS